MKITCDSPGREYDWMNSNSPVFISAFSIGSVTCLDTCSAVAPGHIVCTTIALKVNGGSSDWPRCLYDHAPMTAMAIIMNSTSGRLLNAHSERLKRRTPHSPFLAAGAVVSTGRLLRSTAVTFWPSRSR
ncbi:hypothetical protein D3C81_649290 [compost metagenome]